jgi:hypothetical protein
MSRALGFCPRGECAVLSSDLTGANDRCSKRQRPLGEGLLSWPMSIFKADHEDIKMQNGMDAYFFVRYLRMMVRVFLPIW